MKLSKTMAAVAALSLAFAAAAGAQDKPADPKAAPAAEQQKPPAPKPFPEGAKIAYISLQYIASNSAEGKAATAKIQEFTKKKQAELADKQKALEALRNKLLQGGGVLSEQARSQMEKDIDRMNRELQFAQQDAQAEQQQLTADLQREFQARLNPILDQVAQDRNLHMVVNIEDSGAIWVNTGLDLSQEVMKRLDASAKTAGK